MILSGTFEVTNHILYKKKHILHRKIQ